MVHMPTLLRRIHKLVSTSQIDRLVSPAPSMQYPALWVKTVRHFSFADNKSGSTKQHDGESDEDYFLQQSDPSFDDTGSNGSKEGYNTHQFSEEPVPNRALRGKRPINRGSRSFSPRFDENRGRPGEVDKTNKSSQADHGLEGGNGAETNRDADQSGDSFLDKFKLGFDNKTVNSSVVAPSNKSEEAMRSNLNQSAQDFIPQDADEIFKKMKETGLIPNAVAMLDGLCKDGLVQEALKLFGLMREKGTIPEIVIYTAVVEGFTKAHRADDAKRIFRKMQSNGISPNAFSYTVIIQGLYKCTRLEEALEFCLEMLEAGHSPNTTTFVGLIDSFCKEKGVEEAKDAIKTLEDKGFTFNEKAVREFLDKKAPFSPSVWEAIFGKKAPQRPF